MHKLQALTALTIAALCAFAQADDIRPGLWKITVELGVAATPDWKPQPFELTQCLTQADAENPAQLLLGMGSSGATGCDFLNREYSGNGLKFDVSCPGMLGIKGHGEVTYTATTLEGSLNVNMGESEKIVMQNRIHATYLGDCPAGRAGQ